MKLREIIGVGCFPPYIKEGWNDKSIFFFKQDKLIVMSKKHSYPVNI